MSEYGFVITTPGGRKHRFEDSTRWGPSPLRKDGELSNARIWSPRNSFWAAHATWSRQGKRVAADGVTCIVDMPATDAELMRMEDAANAKAMAEFASKAEVWAKASDHPFYGPLRTPKTEPVDHPYYGPEF